MTPAGDRVCVIARGCGILLGILLSFAAAAQTFDGSNAAALADQAQNRITQLRTSLGRQNGGVLGLMGYNMTPDGSTNAVTISRGNATSTDGSTTLQLSQFGSGFTLSEAFPLYLEGYIGYARYDPRAYITGGEEGRKLPLRWNNFTTTIGVGYDIRLAENLWLRPILNGSLGYAASDVSLFGSFVHYRTGIDTSALSSRHMNVYGLGGSLVLAYYDYTPARSIDFELRYTQMRLQSFGDTPPGVGGTSIPRTVGLWGRYRWPTGWEAFGRPVRWVIDGSGSIYLGDQRDALGFNWSMKIGGGIEFDLGRHEIGAMGLNVQRVRLIGRYFYGDGGVTGVSLGIGVSF